jgi:hypothetical protein
MKINHRITIIIVETIMAEDEEVLPVLADASPVE